MNGDRSMGNAILFSALPVRAVNRLHRPLHPFSAIIFNDCGGLSGIIPPSGVQGQHPLWPHR